MNWLIFFIGVIAGGGIVYYFWRRNAQEARETELMLRQRLTDAESEIRRLTAQLDGLKRQEEPFTACQAELQKKTDDLQQVTKQLSTAEAQIRSLRDQLAATDVTAKQSPATEMQIRSLQDQLAATGSKEEQLAAAEAQIQTLRDQLDESEARAETKRKQFSSAKARIRSLSDQLADSGTKSEVVTEEAPASVQRDDLTKIEGIGPKVSQVLNENGILTFAQLAHTEVPRLRTILQDAGPRFRIIEPESWPEQAGFAANGNWDALTKLQDELDGGKYRR